MQKNINVTLNKIVFNIEEDAYELLKGYLDSIKRHFAPTGDVNEILADMESSIAEKFTEKISAKDRVITKPDVENLIKVMGTIEDIDKGADGGVNGLTGGVKKIKKLYRNPDDAIIAGVCSGLAAHFNLDPMIVRLIFIISVFFGGVGILIYAILWVVMPEAKSSVQKLEMAGSPVTLKKMEETIRKKIRQAGRTLKQTGEENRGLFKKIITSFLKALNATAVAIRVSGKYFLVALAIIIGASLVLGMMAAIFGLIFTGAVLLFNRDSAYLVSDFPLNELAQTIPYDLLVLSVLVIAVVPLVFLLLSGLTLIKRKNVFNGIFSGVLIGLWLIAIIALGVITLDSYPIVEEQINEYALNWEAQAITKTFDFKDFNRVNIGGAYEADIAFGKEYQVTAFGRERDFEKMDLRVIDGQLEVNQKIFGGFCFICFIKPVKINVTMPKLEQFTLSAAAKAEISGFNLSKLAVEASGATEATLNSTVKDLNLDVSGSSQVTLSGSGQSLKVKASGASEITGYDFPVSEAGLDLSGASEAQVNVKDNLNVKASGASQINYLGSPEITSELTGASELLRLDN